MSNVIFLDIDGVLKHPTQNIWYPEAIAYLNDYCQHNNVYIVISSTWRMLKDVSFFNEMLNNKVIGITEDLSRIHESYTRHHECLKYVNDKSVDNYAILDDKINEYKDLSKVVEIESALGINFKSIFKLNAILKLNIHYLISENIVIVDKFR